MVYAEWISGRTRGDGVGKSDHRFPHNLPTSIVPTNITWLKLSGKFPMNLGIPPRKD